MSQITSFFLGKVLVIEKDRNGKKFVVVVKYLPLLLEQEGTNWIVNRLTLLWMGL